MPGGWVRGRVLPYEWEGFCFWGVEPCVAGRVEPSGGVANDSSGATVLPLLAVIM